MTERLQSAQSKLPEGIENPQVSPISSPIGTIVTYAFISKTSDLMEVWRIVEWQVTNRLLAVPGVTQAIVFGGDVWQYQVLVAPEKLQAFNVSLPDVSDAVAAANVNAPGGYLITPDREKLIRGIGRIENIEAYQQTIQKALTDGTLVRIDERNKDFIASASKIVNAQPGTVLIYPLVLSDKVHLLWASQGGVLSSVTCPIGEQQLNRTIASFQAALQSPNDIAAVKQHGKALYDCLIKPLEEKGEWKKNKIQNLVIAADRAINYIPFGALFDGKQFVVERYTTSNVLNAGLTDVDTRLPSNPSRDFGKVRRLLCPPQYEARIAGDRAFRSKSQRNLPGQHFAQPSFNRIRL